MSQKELPFGPIAQSQFIPVDQIRVTHTQYAPLETSWFFGLYIPPYDKQNTAPAGYHEIQIGNFDNLQAMVEEDAENIENASYPHQRTTQLAKRFAARLRNTEFSSPGAKEAFRDGAIKHENTHRIQELRCRSMSLLTAAIDLFDNQSSHIYVDDEPQLRYLKNELRGLSELQAKIVELIDFKNPKKYHKETLLYNATKAMYLLAGDNVESQALHFNIDYMKSVRSMGLPGYETLMLFTANPDLLADVAENDTDPQDVSAVVEQNISEVLDDPSHFIDKISDKDFLARVDLRLMDVSWRIKEQLDQTRKN